MDQWVSDNVLFLRPTQERLAGEAGSDVMQSAFRGAFETGHLALAVDLRNVKYMDVGVVRTFIAEFKFLNRYHGLMCVLNVTGELYEFLAQTVLGKVIDICHNEHDAMMLFEGVSKRRHVAGGIRRAIGRMYSWGYGAGILPNRRARKSRRVEFERRQASDRRTLEPVGDSS